MYRERKAADRPEQTVDTDETRPVKFTSLHLWTNATRWVYL